MKTIHSAALLISAFVLCSTVQASTGTISFTGTLTSATCTVEPGAGSGGAANNIEVDLGTVSFRDLSNGTGTDFGAATRINLDINCASAIGLTLVKMGFRPGDGSGSDVSDPRLLRTAGGAVGVGIGIIDETNRVLALNASEVISAPLVVDGGGGATASMSMRAAYILNGVAGTFAGAATGSLPFTLTYE